MSYYLYKIQLSLSPLIEDVIIKELSDLIEMARKHLRKSKLSHSKDKSLYMLGILIRFPTIYILQGCLSLPMLW